MLIQGFWWKAFNENTWKYCNKKKLVPDNVRMKGFMNSLNCLVIIQPFWIFRISFPAAIWPKLLNTQSIQPRHLDFRLSSMFRRKRSQNLGDTHDIVTIHLTAIPKKRLWRWFWGYSNKCVWSPKSSKVN